MSLFLIAALSMASATQAPASTITPSDRPQIVQAARRMNVPTRALYRALTAREQSRESVRGRRYCLPLSTVVSGKSGQVCHTRRRWDSFGLTIVTAAV